MPNAMLRVDCTPLYQPALLEEACLFLTDDRRRRIHRLANAGKKAQCAAAGLLLYALFSVGGAPPVLLYGPHGKPYLSGRPGAFFSLSHTANWVFCGTADGEIGLDAQRMVPWNARIVRRCFSAAEQALLNKAPSDQAFTRVWTCKEAYLKYTGLGLSFSMNRFSVPFPAEGYDQDTACFWRECILDGVQVAVCTEKEMDGRIKTCSVEALLAYCREEERRPPWA